MEETGVLVNLALLDLVLPDFEPGLKTSQCAPRVSGETAKLKTSQCAPRLGGEAAKLKTSQCAPRLRKQLR